MHVIGRGHNIVVAGKFSWGNVANKHQTRIVDANYKTDDLKEIIKCISTIDDIEKFNI
jgi:hypothetical protein